MKDNINDRFIVPKSKLDLLLAPIQSSPNTANNNNAKANYSSNNEKRKK
jgi:hypothetical protein